jgi:uncharacterized protein
MEDRIENVRTVIEGLLETHSTPEQVKDAHIHLYGVALFASLLAKKRALNNEYATIVGMLHDISNYIQGETRKHAKLSAGYAEEILGMADFSKTEVSLIATAVANHSNKAVIDDPYSELLKDADVLHHYFYNISFDILEKDRERLSILLKELGL